MKKNFVLFYVSIFVFAIFATSCVSTKKTEGGKKNHAAITNSKKSDSYKLIKLNEDFDYLTAKISFPEFENNETLNKLIRNSVMSNYNNLKKFAQTSWAEINELNSKNSEVSTLPPYEFFLESEIYGDKKIISVLTVNYVFVGGAHGNTILKSYNFDSETGKFLNIAEVLNLSYDEISKKCKEKLSKTLAENNKNVKTPSEEKEVLAMINEGTAPQAGNFEIFTVSKNSVTIYFEPYAVAPYSYGIQKVEIKKE